MRAETIRDMAKQARNVIILTESEKFLKCALVNILPFNEVAAVITDNAIKPEIERFIAGQGIRVYKV
jgi:DeoR/GlpR family transcriptional regulator of sugar metabolism